MGLSRRTFQRLLQFLGNGLLSVSSFAEFMEEGEGWRGVGVAAAKRMQ